MVPTQKAWEKFPLRRWNLARLQIIADYAKKTDQTAIEIIKEKNIQKLLRTYEPK